MLAKQLQGAAKGVAVDSDFENVTLLLHGNGTNGAQNNTFIDGSSNAFSITRNGNTTQGTFSPYGSNWSNYFDGSGDYLTGPTNNAAFQFGTGDFTVEMWVNTSNLSNYQTLLDARSGDTQSAWCLFIDNTGKPYWYDASGVQLSSTAITANTWTHLAVARSGSALKMFLAGSEVYSGTNSNSQNASGTFYVGRNAVNAFLYTGYISNLRIVKGTAVYTAAFTPPTAPLTAITNTSLLTCQSNRFIDNSTNAFTITRNGDVSVQRFSPFSPTAAYASGTIGGSGYFDGTGDYLSASANTAFQFGTGNFTIEYWYYPTVFGTNTPIDMGYANTGSYVIQSASDGKPYFYSGTTGVVFTATTGYLLNAWNHLAVTRSGTTLSMFINGVRVGTATNSTNFNANFSLGIGGSPTHSTAYEVTGYLSSVRLLKGTAVYDPTLTTLTVPTAPLTNITNTSILCNFTNAGIIDNAMMNDLETVGNAQISTTQSKFGGGSMYFDGTGDYLVSNTATPDLYAFGTGDFTIEFWVYFPTLPSSGNFAGLIDFRPFNTQGVYPDIYFVGSTQTIRYFVNSADRISGSTALSATTWYHVAVARSGTSTKMFLNGTQEGSTYTDSNSYLCPATRPIIASLGYDPSLYPFNGYIDDLRITKGVARYTANFTAPTAPFADQ